jgi:UDP-glucose 4-epimerase
LIVLVTGATGFVAGHLIPHLARGGHTVVAAGHDLSRLPAAGGVLPLCWDLSQPTAPAGVPRQLDAIVHLVQANVPFPDRAAEMFAVNVASTQLLLEIARSAGARRFVFTSTGSVYGPADRPRTEDDPTHGADYYAATKIAAERLVRAYGDHVPYTIFRLFAPYGPRQRNRMIPGLINRVIAGTPVTVAGGTGPAYNPVHVNHVMDVLTQSLGTSGNQLLNLGGDEALTIRDMALIIGRVVGREPVIEEQAGSAGRFVGDLSLLRRSYRLPDRLISFEDGVRTMLAA